MLTIIRLLFPRKCSSNYPSAIKVAGKKKVSFTFGFFLFLLRSYGVSLKAGLPEKQSKTIICRTFYFLCTGSFGSWDNFPLSSQLCKYSLRVCVWQWMNRAAAAHLAGFKPSLAVPSEGHSLSGDTGRCKWFWHSLRPLSAWEENLDGSSCHGWSLRGSWKTLFLLKGRTTFLSGILKIGQIDAFHMPFYFIFFFKYQRRDENWITCSSNPRNPEINTSDLSLFNIGRKNIRTPLASQIVVNRETA